MEPALRVLRSRRRLRVLVVLLEQARRADQQFPFGRKREFHALHRGANGVRLHLAVGLDADEDAGLRRTVELLQIDAERAVEAEQVRSDRLARRIGDAHPAHAQHVPQRPVDDGVAQPVPHSIHRTHVLAVQDVAADVARDIHEIAIQRTLEGTRILHADRDLGEQRLEHARRREIISRPDVAHVAHHGLGRFRAADAIAGDERLRVGKDVLPDPGRRQVGQHDVRIGQALQLRGGARAVDQAMMGKHHAFRDARGAGGEEHGRRVRARALGDLGLEESRIATLRLGAELEQLVATHELGLAVMAQAARFVVEDVHKRWALRQYLEQLVDLLLVLRDREFDGSILDRKGHLGRHRILIERYRNAAQALRRAHRGIDPGSIVADDGEVIAALETPPGEAAGQRAHLVGETPPAPGLPDSKILLADRRALRADPGMVHQQLWKRVQAGINFRHFSLLQGSRGFYNAKLPLCTER